MILPFRQLRRRRGLRVASFVLLLGLIAGAVAAANIWWLLRPERVRALVAAELTRVLNVPYRLGAIHLGIFDGLIVEGLTIEAPAGCEERIALEIPRLAARIDVWQYLRGGPVISEVVISNPKVRLELLGDGTVNLQSLLAPANLTTPSSATPTAARRAPRIPKLRVDDLEVVTCSKTIFQMSAPLRIEQFTLESATGLLKPLESGDYRFAGTGAYPEVGGITLSGTLTADFARAEATIEILRVRLEERLAQRLPPAIAPFWAAYRPEGVADLTVKSRLENAKFEILNATLDIVEASLTIAEPPVAITSVSGRVELARDELRIVEPLRGLAVGGAARLEGGLTFGDWQVQSSQFTLWLEQLPVSGDTRTLLSGDLVGLFDALRPRGRLGLKLSLGGADLGRLALEEVTLDRMDLLPRAFPYPLREISGAVTNMGDGYRIDLNGGEPGRPLSVNGVWRTDPDAASAILLRVQNLACEERLEKAIPGLSRHIYQQFGAQGDVNLEFRLVRTAKTATASPEAAADSGFARMRLTVDLEPVAASMSHVAFPYRISDLQGRARFEGHFAAGAAGLEFRADTLVLSDVRGRHGRSLMALDHGGARFARFPGDHFELDLEISSPNLLIEKDLIAAFTPEAAAAIRDFGIDGNFDTRVRIATGANGKIDTSVEAHVNAPVTVRFAPFPFPLHFLTGTVRHDTKSGTTQLSDLGTDPAFGPRIEVSGDHGPYSLGDGKPASSGDLDPALARPLKDELFLSLRVDLAPQLGDPKLDLADAVFVESLPDDLRHLFRSLELKGAASGNLRVNYRYRPQGDGPPATEQTTYSGEVTVASGAANLGVEVSEVAAAMTVFGDAGRRGAGDREPYHELSVHVPAGAFRFSRFQVTNADATFYYGAQHPAVSLSRTGTVDARQSFRLDETFIERLRPGRVAQDLQVLIRKAEVYGGYLRGFFYVNVGSTRDLRGHFLCDEIDLAKGGDLFPRKTVSGRAAGEVVFSGSSRAAQDMTGRGWFGVRDGKLNDLPLTSLIINPIVLVRMFEADALTIRDMDTRFTIQNGRFHVKEYEDLELKSRAMRILGKGEMDFDLNLDFWCVPQTFGGLPLVSDFFNTIGRRRITGTLDDPKVSVLPF
ncbi:MAG: hypothetical protein ACKVX7_04410 [Planctomycetota bacterium]